MRLRIYVPSRVVIDTEVNKLIAESLHGSFCILPRHVDYAAVLDAGLLSYERADTGSEEFLAVDQGILVKRGLDVRVSARKAVGGAALESLGEKVEIGLQELNEQEAKTRTIIAKLEVDFIRKAIGMESA